MIQNKLTRFIGNKDICNEVLQKIVHIKEKYNNFLDKSEETRELYLIDEKDADFIDSIGAMQTKVKRALDALNQMEDAYKNEKVMLQSFSDDLWWVDFRELYDHVECRPHHTSNYVHISEMQKSIKSIMDIEVIILYLIWQNEVIIIN